MSSLFRISLQQKQQTKAIRSPLARVAAGKLRCNLCSTVVARGASAIGALAVAAWDAHEKSKEHLYQAEAVKAQVKNKRSAPKSNAGPVNPPKMPRGILKNAPPKPIPVVVETVEENGSKEEVQIETVEPPAKVDKKVAKKTNKNSKMSEADEAIPEGFFDDPIKDAKARNIQYKDPIEEEWEKFQKEMKEETNLSAAIVAGEREEAAAERQIDEIEEQIRNLSKVLDLNKKKEEVAKQKALEEASAMDTQENSSEEDDNFEEYLDWRAKKSYR